MILYVMTLVHPGQFQFFLCARDIPLAHHIDSDVR